MTLPLIYALNKASWLDRRLVIYKVKNQNDKPAKVREVIEFVKASGGIAYAESVMQRYIDEAMELLTSLPESSYKTSLQQLVIYTIERNK